jgi:spore maturation protein B
MGAIQSISLILLPLTIFVILISGWTKKVDLFETFAKGGKEGMEMAMAILPFLIGMIVAISVFRSSGAMEWMVSFIEPLTNLLKIPTEIVPLMFIRPISGTASLAFVDHLMNQHGADSFIGKLASVIQGSTDTTIYVLTVYFGAVGITKTGDALKIGLLADIAGFIVAIMITMYFFGY